ncbi:hypothetical protein Pfo_001969 [Paulownia fortunei]|nr:hypothetical protein Pfo_001969 [Paulownia fortunei]
MESLRAGAHCLLLEHVEHHVKHDRREVSVQSSVTVRSLQQIKHHLYRVLDVQI